MRPHPEKIAKILKLGRVNAIAKDQKFVFQLNVQVGAIQIINWQPKPFITKFVVFGFPVLSGKRRGQ